MSFVDLFNDIGKYIDDKHSRWKFVLRVKRGLSDTSEAGGLYKDQVYLEGAVAILQERHSLDFHGLCCGKISIEDMKKLASQKKLKKDLIKIPPFMRDMDTYMQALDIIAKVNHIDEFVQSRDLENNNENKYNLTTMSSTAVPPANTLPIVISANNNDVDVNDNDDSNQLQ